MAEEKEVLCVQTEGDTDLLDLVDKAIELPELGIVRLVAVCRAQLVVVVVLDARRRQVAVAGFEVLMGARRTAMEEQQLRSRVVPEALGPDVKLPLGSGDRNPPRAAA